MKTIMLMAAVCAAALFLTTGCACCHGDKASAQPGVAAKCDGSCCKDEATCAKCCKDEAGCKACCKKS